MIQAYLKGNYILREGSSTDDDAIRFYEIAEFRVGKEVDIYDKNSRHWGEYAIIDRLSIYKPTAGGLEAKVRLIFEDGEVRDFKPEQLRSQTK